MFGTTPDQNNQNDEKHCVKQAVKLLDKSDWPSRVTKMDVLDLGKSSRGRAEFGTGAIYLSELEKSAVDLRTVDYHELRYLEGKVSPPKHFNHVVDLVLFSMAT